MFGYLLGARGGGALQPQSERFHKTQDNATEPIDLVPSFRRGGHCKSEQRGTQDRQPTRQLVSQVRNDEGGLAGRRANSLYGQVLDRERAIGGPLRLRAAALDDGGCLLRHVFRVLKNTLHLCLFIVSAAADTHHE